MKRLRQLNDNRDPYRFIEVAVGWILVAVWIILTIRFIWSVSGTWSFLSVNWFPIVVSNVWFGVLGGSAASWSFVEGNRWLYSHDFLLPFLDDGTRQVAQPRIATRIEPVVTGIVERGLLMPLGVLILIAAKEPPIGALGAIAAGYVVLKSIKRFTSSPVEQTLNASIGSIWGSSLSVAFAFLGAWWYSEIA